jgi:hypothetical protein
MRRLTRYLLLCSAVLSLGLSLPEGARAQGSEPHIQITQVDNSRFPQVTVYVSVTDAAGEPVYVDPATIQISENGKPMQATNVGGGGQGGVGPLTTMLVMDVSGSMDRTTRSAGRKPRPRPTWTRCGPATRQD